MIEEKLKQVEESYDWESAIQIMDQAILRKKLDAELSYRISFLLAYFCSDMPHTKEQLLQASQSLCKYIEVSKQFINDPEYLVFSSLSIYLSYFYIGYDTPIEAVLRIEKATELDSTNTFYQWVLSLVKDQSSDADEAYKLELAQKVLDDRKNYPQWLETKGLVGKYLVGMLSMRQ